MYLHTKGHYQEETVEGKECHGMTIEPWQRCCSMLKLMLKGNGKMKKGLGHFNCTKLIKAGKAVTTVSQ